MGRSIRTHSSHPDPSTATNLHLNDTAVRSANELSAAPSNVPTLDSFRRMPNVNDAVMQLLSYCEQGKTQELLVGSLQQY